jgi:deoxyribodipyrimidine photolyase-related protein
MATPAPQNRTLRLVLGDQLTERLSALRGAEPGDVVLMAEVMDECTYVPHHARKIVLVLSAMRHFAETLRAQGLTVDYIRLDDPANTHSLRSETMRAAARHHATSIVTTEPGEYRLLRDLAEWHTLSDCTVDILDDDRFLCSIREFRDWAAGRRGLRMEFFYRDMRRRHALLMEGDEPAGGQWNFDHDNRKRLPREILPPPIAAFPPDAITTEVIALVAARFADHVGTAEGFAYPVTPADAEAALQEFIETRLAKFGDWQDAMKTDAPFMFHSVISAALNLGLLDPGDICRRAEAAWRQGLAPLNAVEGFIRQILGWREFVRGVYWMKMPEYGRLNALAATRPLPWFYWSGETRMACMAQAIGQTVAHAYAHHIHRLMITGNFALLAGLDPTEVDAWYLAVYADAYEWVEMPNTRGMALFADNGVMGSKPYAASGAYINRMSDYCGTCTYDVKQPTGPRACPFNYLYWDFMARHADRFAPNPRMAMPLRTLAGFTPARVQAIRASAADFLGRMEAGDVV